MWHVLALALGGRTVSELMSAMSQVEFERWKHFYERFPFDDVHRYQRPAALMAKAAAPGSEMPKLLEWLGRPLVQAPMDPDARTLAALGIKKPKEK